MELRRNAFANKYPAVLKSFQAPTSSLLKYARMESKSPLSSCAPIPRKATTPAVTRALYRCFACKNENEFFQILRLPRLEWTVHLLFIFVPIISMHPQPWLPQKLKLFRLDLIIWRMLILLNLLLQTRQMIVGLQTMRSCRRFGCQRIFVAVVVETP